VWRVAADNGFVTAGYTKPDFQVLRFRGEIFCRGNLRRTADLKTGGSRCNARFARSQTLEYEHLRHPW
jgi:hypothetical protein